MKLVILTVCLIIALAQGCFQDDGSMVTIGEETSVCIMLSRLKWGEHNDDGSILKGKFLTVKALLKADEFSKITVTEAWTSLKYSEDAAMASLDIVESSKGNGMGVAVGSLNVPSYQKAYRRVDMVNSERVTFPVLMAVIRVENGVVKEIVWDDTCDWCETSRCAANTYNYSGELVRTESKSCFLHDEECVMDGAAEGSQPECGLKVYVSWTGTDSKGFHFLSSATRFSRLSEAQVKSLLVEE